MHDFPPQQQKPGGEVLRSCVSFPVSKSFQHSCALSPPKEPIMNVTSKLLEISDKLCPDSANQTSRESFLYLFMHVTMEILSLSKSRGLLQLYLWKHWWSPDVFIWKKNQTYRLCLWMKGRLAKSGQVNLVSESLRWMSTIRTSWQIFQNCLYFRFVHMVNYSLNQWATTHELCIYVL